MTFANFVGVQIYYDESARQLEGELDKRIGKQRQTVSAGGFANAPRGSTHALKNNSANKVHIIRVHTSGGFERRLGKQQGR